MIKFIIFHDIHTLLHTAEETHQGEMHDFNTSNTSAVAPKYPPAYLTYQILILKSRGHVNSSLYLRNLENLCHMVRVQQMRIKIHMFWSNDPIFY